MACFVVPATEAIVTTVATKVLKSKEAKAEENALANGVSVSDLHTEHFSTKLSRLNKLLWGGSALLAFEHVWHGEVTPFFPFLTAASNPVDFSEMLHEMSTVGVTMAVLTTLVWGVATYALSAKSAKDSSKELAK